MIPSQLHFLLAAAIAIPVAAQAAARTWAGNSDTNWATAANWDVIPVSGDSLTFNAAGAAGATLTNTLTTSAFNVAGITFGASAASYSMSGNAFSLTGNIVNNLASGSQTLSNDITLSGATRTITTVTGGKTTLSGILSGSVGLTKGAGAGNAGTLELLGANTYAGVTTLVGSAVVVNTLNNGSLASSLGQSSNAAANLVFNGGALSYVGTAAASTDRLFTLTATAVIQNNSVSSANTLTFSNTGSTAHTVNSVAHNVTLGGANTGDNLFALTITTGGTGTKLVKADAGKWIVTNAGSTYAGGTDVNAGTLAFNSGALATTGAITMNGGALQWNGSNTQDVSSRLTLVAVKTATFDTNGNAVTLATGFGGGLSAGVTKTGAGTLTLGGAVTHTGATTVTGGTLALGASGSIATSTAIAVSSGATFDVSAVAAHTIGGSQTLSGAGTVTGSTTVNGILQGGNGTVGTTLTTTNGTVALASGSVIQLALDGTFAHSTLAAGTGGSFTFQASQAFNFQDLGATTGTYTNLITGAANGEVVTGWTIANAGWAGNFVNDGAGNISLTLTAIPEPSTYGLLGAGALAAVAFVRRRRRAPRA